MILFEANVTNPAIAAAKEFASNPPPAMVFHMDDKPWELPGNQRVSSMRDDRVKPRAIDGIFGWNPTQLRPSIDVNRAHLNPHIPSVPRPVGIDSMLWLGLAGLVTAGSPSDRRAKAFLWSLTGLGALSGVVAVANSFVERGQRLSMIEQVQQYTDSCKSGQILTDFTAATKQLDTLSLEHGVQPVAMPIPSFDEEQAQVTQACNQLKKLDNRAAKIKDDDPDRLSKVSAVWTEGVDDVGEINTAFGSVNTKLAEPREAMIAFADQTVRYAKALELPMPERKNELVNAQENLRKSKEALEQGNWEDARLLANAAALSLNYYFSIAPKTATATWAPPSPTASITMTPTASVTPQPSP